MTSSGTTPWAPTSIVLSTGDYGPYHVEIDAMHLIRDRFARPRFPARSVRHLIDDNARAMHGVPAASALSIRWDGDDVVLDFGTRYDAGGARTERVTPDAHGMYRLLDGWPWELVALMQGFRYC